MSPTKNVADNPIVDPQTEFDVGVHLDHLTHLYVLDSIKGFGPQKFKAIHEYNISPRTIVEHPSKLPIFGKKGDEFRAALTRIDEKNFQECRHRASNQITSAHRYGVKILTYSHPAYPQNIYQSNNPVPILFVKGSLDVLADVKVIACVGSRKIRFPYSEIEEEFVSAAVSHGFVIASGFATGADRIGHETAFRKNGRTICVMPCGLDTSFPPENKSLREEFLLYPGAVFISEFAFGIRASSLTLRRRNKLIVACSIGVLIAQSDVKGGAMNAYKFAREQHKPIATFESDGMADTSGNEHIISERAFNDRIFSLRANRGEYTEWLKALSSLI